MKVSNATYERDAFWRYKTLRDAGLVDVGKLVYKDIAKDGLTYTYDGMELNKDLGGYGIHCLVNSDGTYGTVAVQGHLGLCWNVPVNELERTLRGVQSLVSLTCDVVLPMLRLNDVGETDKPVTFDNLFELVTGYKGTPVRVQGTEYTVLDAAVYTALERHYGKFDYSADVLAYAIEVSKGFESDVINAQAYAVVLMNYMTWAHNLRCELGDSELNVQRLAFMGGPYAERFAEWLITHKEKWLDKQYA